MWVWEPIVFKPTPLHLGVHKVEGKHRAGSSELRRTRARVMRRRRERSERGREGGTAGSGTPGCGASCASAPLRRAAPCPPGEAARDESCTRGRSPPRDSCRSDVFVCPDLPRTLTLVSQGPSSPARGHSGQGPPDPNSSERQLVLPWMSLSSSGARRAAVLFDVGRRLSCIQYNDQWDSGCAAAGDGGGSSD